MSDFRQLDRAETQKLMEALRGNADRGEPLHMDRSTRFTAADEDESRRVGSLVASTPIHY